MARVNKERQVVDVLIDVDTNKLYGPLPEAIRYLQDIRDSIRGHEISLYENWTGYETMNMCFTYQRLETDQEYEDRLNRERLYEQAYQQEIARLSDRKKKEAEYERLKRELGF